MGKKSSKATTTTIYGNTTTTNPYVTSKTDNSGTVSVFNKGTALDSINDFVNNNMNSLLQEYLNPTLSSTTNQAKLNSFINNLTAQSQANLENNIVNPLSKRNMIRSSQATDMYKNLAQTNASQIAEYAQNLLAGSQKDTASLLANLMLWYMNGYDVLNDTQKQSLSTSQGNATKTQSGGSSSNDSSGIYRMLQAITQMAMMAEGM